MYKKVVIKAEVERYFYVTTSKLLYFRSFCKGGRNIYYILIVSDSQFVM